MGSGFSKMKKQAKMLQEQLQTAQQKLQSLTVTGQAGNGLVTIELNGEKEIKNIVIQSSCVDPKDIEGLQDLIIAAHRDAWKKIQQEESSSTPSQLPFFR